MVGTRDTMRLEPQVCFLLLLYTVLNKTNTLCRQMEVTGLKKGRKMGRDSRCAVYRVPGIFFFIFYLFTILTKTYALGGEWR